MSTEPARPNPDDAFDPTKHDALAEAIKKLSPEEAAHFLWKLEVSLKKRKIQLSGYLAAILMWLLGMVSALVYYGVSDGFVGWVFLVPFAFVGVILWAFGKWADKVSKQKPPQDLVLKG